MLYRSWRGISYWITTLGAESARSRQTWPGPTYGAGGRDITTTQPAEELAMLGGQWHSAGRGQTATQSRGSSSTPRDKPTCSFQPRDPLFPTKDNPALANTADAGHSIPKSWGSWWHQSLLQHRS